MQFFFPDSQDLVDPSFDFATEKRSDTRVRQRDDLYAHEIFKNIPYDGMLVSKAIVEGAGQSTGRYTLGQQRRFSVGGVKAFLRVPPSMKVMGDCGAFTYVKEEVPPVGVEEVTRFYQDAGFDYGASIDHVILEYNPAWDHNLPGIEAVPAKCLKRQDITLAMARDFRQHCMRERVTFEPLGVAQGWSPNSYAQSVSALQKMGYRYIALGGMVPLKTSEIIAVLTACYPRLRSDTRLHLFGVTRLTHIPEFRSLGVVSFDSTSPLRQAFKEDRGNYYSRIKDEFGNEKSYTAIRVPQVDVNVHLKNRILSGQVKQGEAFRLEKECLNALRAYDKKPYHRKELIQLLIDYQSLFGNLRNYAIEYDQILKDQPWKECNCEVCRSLGINAVIFRGAERNRRRGFHNLHVTYQRLKSANRRKIPTHA
ncbi:MAG: tRNA-guanine transglycosylase DpdA [Planctomycetaceae bacterium]|jgi:hypothetical protein